MSDKSQVAIINDEIKKQLANEGAVRTLLATTFKGFDQVLMKQALFEGMLMGFDFKDFLSKDVYAIKYGSAYSLVTSIDLNRKIAMRSGLAGINEPVYSFNSDSTKVEKCSVTVKRRVDGNVDEYTATVYFNEYTTGKNLWSSKPMTMIAKVAEMHALRKAFPEQLAKSYVAEEQERTIIQAEIVEDNLEEWKEKLEKASLVSKEEFQKVWVGLPGTIKKKLEDFKAEIMKKYETETVPE